MTPRQIRLLGAAVVASIVAFAAARARHERALRHDAPIWPDETLAPVPHARGSISLDGDTDDPGWKGPCLRTGRFVGADGVTPVHPQSEARLLWGDGFLYLNLYAADEDIRVKSRAPDGLSPDEDTFHLVFTDATTERVIDINPLGFVTDGKRVRGATTPPDLSWNGDIHVSHELDGTPNKPDDNDEEWVLEVAIPFASLGLSGEAGERIGLSMQRCDTTHKGARVCGAWGEHAHEVLVLAPP